MRLPPLPPPYLPAGFDTGDRICLLSPMSSSAPKLPNPTAALTPGPPTPGARSL